MELKIGTRASLLALTQSETVKKALLTTDRVREVELVKIKTLGDRKQGTVKASDSDKKDWVVDLEQALVAGEIDLAVHSGKDIPVDIEPGTTLLPVLTRANAFDCFIGRQMDAGQARWSFSDLPEGAKVGTASLRRQAYLLRLRPDLQVVEHRGNVPTRLQKMQDSDDIMGIVLAQAGIDRLGLHDISTENFRFEQMIPAINQGILVVQCRVDDQATIGALQQISDSTLMAIWQAERAVAVVLEGDCKSAIGIYAHIVNEQIELMAAVMSPDGRDYLHVVQSGPLATAHQLGLDVGHELLAKGADRIIAQAALS